MKGWQGREILSTTTEVTVDFVHKRGRSGPRGRNGRLCTSNKPGDFLCVCGTKASPQVDGKGPCTKFQKKKEKRSLFVLRIFWNSAAGRGSDYLLTSD